MKGKMKKGVKWLWLFTPSPVNIIAVRWIRAAIKVTMAGRAIYKHALALKSGTMEELIGKELAYTAIALCGGRFANQGIACAMNQPLWFCRAKTWFSSPHKTRVVVVAHHANKAGRHIDLHIGKVSAIYKFPGRFEYNASGELTQECKRRILDFVKSNIRQGKPAPQNWDHGYFQARESWTLGKGPESGYGSGPARQVVADLEALVLKTGQSTFHYYCPELAPRECLYVHALARSGKRILVNGILKANRFRLDDKLHLKLVKSLDEFRSKVRGGIVMRKYDGASCDIVIDNDGARAFSPRVSQETGQRIEYTGKLPWLAGISSPKRIIVKGELMFMKGGKPLSAAEIGGILNAHELPKGVRSLVYVYRIQGMDSIPYEQQINEIRRIVKLSPYFRVPELVPFHKLGTHPTWEGYVGVPEGETIDNGLKFKYLDDPSDWKVVEVNLHKGPKGNWAGTVKFESLESGRSFKLGPGQIGTNEEVEQIATHPEEYIGRVAKVVSRVGHEGRAAKLLMWHLDK